MAAVKTSKLSHPLLGIVALVFVVGYKNQGGHLRGEFHLIFAGKATDSRSELIKFEQSPHDGDALQITEDVMADVALDEAKMHLNEYVNDLPEVHKNMLALASLSAAEPQDLFQAWVRQQFPQMHQLSFQTESEDLRIFIRSFTKYPKIKASAL
ncbi:hypothetical protein [Xanthomonas melonis]|uniref:Uncharacterized protein n=1 Tax=Xanthomonas melonis TaxID=56456 RepID=A0A2S7DAE5_9XANT|nr:hypothetical protein [Xanthomonas melonis]MCC4601916.1 hypothetical protein [Xanthomonas melonis]PPU70801.1 hypothetical protein XmelCFBP4644_18435 [Xanthomonas melonis]